MSSTVSTVAHIRSFNRAWTEVLGLLDQGLLATDYTLTEARVIFELAQRDSWERLELKERLGIDASFLTRVLSRLQASGLVEMEASPTDGRALTVGLTQLGRDAFSELDQRSDRQILDLIASLTEGERAQLVEAMTVVQKLVAPATDEPEVVIRDLEAGDMGWIVERHGAVYWDEFGWDRDFEALVGRIVIDFDQNFQPDRERAWIAEVDGARAGCVFCCQRDRLTAQLRILLVERWARGMGLGSRLVSECVDFARERGYSKLTLWTNDTLVSARRIYEAAGFRLVDEETHHSFGHDLVGQNWELDLR